MEKYEFEVSVIIPTFNSAQFIGDTLSSAVSQRGIAMEIIVIDGGSTDETLSILYEYAAQFKFIKVLKNECDDGPAHARSIGIKASSGKYIAFLDSDDIWAEGKLAFQISQMITKKLDFTYTYYATYDSLQACHYSAHSFYNLSKIVLFRGIATFTVVVKRDLLTDDIIAYYPGKYAEDYLWWLRLVKKGVCARLVPILGGYYRRHPNSRSVNFIKNLSSINFYLYRELSLNALLRLVIFMIYPLDVAIRITRYNLCTAFSRRINSLIKNLTVRR